MSKKLNKLDHTVPIYSPRTTYKYILQNDENLLADLTLNFDPFTINVLKHEFEIRNWEMAICEFILVVKEHLLSWQTEISNRDIKLIRSLANLFEEIDLNGNGILEWEEFTNYIIEKATVLNNIKSKQDEIKLYTKSSMKPEKKFTQIISKVIYIPEIDKIAFYEDGSDTVQIMNPEGSGIKGLEVQPKPLPVQMSQVKKEQDGAIKIEKKEIVIKRKTMILAILYIPDAKYKVLMTSTNDGYVRGWRYTSTGYVLATQPDNDEEMIEHQFNNEIYCLAWDGIGEILYCGQKDGGINIWNLKTDTESMLEVEGGHTNVVMDMIAMPKLQFMASAALDKALILWNTINNKKKRVYREHTRGIVSLAFNESLILLFSAGFDHDLCVWNPYIDNLIYKIQGHSSPLVGVQVIEGTSQVVSLDSEGVVKIWDTKKFNCVQQFSVETSDEKHKFNPQSFTYIPKPLKLIFAGRTITLYEYDKNYNPNSVDDFVAICCKYIESQMAFFTPAGNKIKIWNALTGDIKRIYSDVTQAEITAFAMDSLDKRMIIGDSNGIIALYNVINGAKIKNLPKHQAEVTSIIHAKEIDAFLTAAMDNKVYMTLDNEFNESELERKFEIKDAVITLINFEPQTKLLLVGTNTGQIAFFETDTGKLHGVFQEQSNIEEITSLNLIPNLPFLISSNSQGKVHVIALPPLLHRFQKAFSFVNTDDGQNLGISNSIYCQHTKRLFLTDDKGMIKVYDLAWLVDMLTKHMRDSEGKQMLGMPKVQPREMVPLFQIKAHNEIIKSLNYVYQENLLITTAYDKRVKIWDSLTGKPVDSFQQNYDRKEPQPIAFKRSGTEEIYNTDLDERVDLKWSLEEKKKQIRTSTNVEDMNVGFNNKKTAQEEFNPFYYLEKLDQNKMIRMKSNPEWKLNVNFEKSYSEYEERIGKLILEVKGKEKELYEKQQKSGGHDRPLRLKEETKAKEQKDLQELRKKGDRQMKNIISNAKESLDKQNKKKEDHEDEKADVYKQEDQDQKDLMQSTSQKLDLNKLGKQKKKLDQQTFERLHRNQLKSKLLFKNEPDVFLSSQECDAAYKLAAALANYDKDDYRSLKFLDIKRKDQKNNNEYSISASHSTLKLPKIKP